MKYYKFVARVFQKLSRNLSCTQQTEECLQVDIILNNNLNLVYFDIKYNQIEALTGTFCNKSNLGKVYLDQNKVKRIDDKLLEDQINLEKITLNGKSLLELQVDLFETLTKLKFLVIQRNELTQT